MEEKELNTNEKKAGFVKPLITVLVFGGLLSGAYAHSVNYYSTRFQPNTEIDGVDLSDLTAEEAEQKLAETYGVSSLTVRGRNGAEETLDVSEANVFRRYKGLEEAVAAQDEKTWILHRGQAKNPAAEFEYGYDAEALERAAMSLDQADPEKTTAPADAYISSDYENGSYEVIPEENGNTVDPQRLVDTLKLAVENGVGEVDLEEAGCYTAPEIFSDNPELNGRADIMNRLEKGTIVLDLGAGTEETLHGDELLEFLGDDSFIASAQGGGAEAGVSEELVTEYVAGLASRYNTYEPDKEKLFIKQDGTPTLIANDYGWQLDEEKTAEKLRTRMSEVGNAVLSGDESVFEKNGEEDPGRLEAVWKKKAASHQGFDYGAYYAEVDLSAQTVYLMDHGKCIFTTPCVSGRMTAGRMTPGGIYQINYKQLHRVLTGYKPDGSIDYQSPVTYWMPFNRGIGFHDATWRGSFGGSLYVYGGSHGCVNLPYSKAKAMYDLVYVGMPVILYY